VAILLINEEGHNHRWFPISSILMSKLYRILYACYETERFGYINEFWEEVIDPDEHELILLNKNISSR